MYTIRLASIAPDLLGIASNITTVMANMGVPSHCIREEASAEGHAPAFVVDSGKKWRRRVECGENMYGSPKKNMFRMDSPASATLMIVPGYVGSMSMANDASDVFATLDVSFLAILCRDWLR